MNVLSLFNGMSCGMIALERAGIEVDNYYSSEIDKYAITVTQANYPDTIQLGDVTKWREWDLPTIDIIMAGSPCQGFSFAGKQLNFDDERSALFFEFIDILKNIKPKYFLLENVLMSEKSNDVISCILGEMYPECVTQAQLFQQGRLEPIMINSALVSAQNRKRLYWTNIPGVEKPEDKGVLLSDILEDGIPYIKVTKNKHLKKYQDKADCLSVGGHGCGNHSDMDLLLPLEHSYLIPRGNNKGGPRSLNGKVPSMTSSKFQDNVFHVSRKSKTVRSSRRGSDDRHEWDKIGLRRYTCVECERLQTVPDNYTNHVSNSQRYKMLGNGWTVDVIAHILNSILTPATPGKGE